MQYGSPEGFLPAVTRGFVWDRCVPGDADGLNPLTRIPQRLLRCTASLTFFSSPGFSFPEPRFVPCRGIRLPRTNMASADGPGPRPQAKWHPFGFDARTPAGGRSRRLGVGARGRGSRPRLLVYFAVRTGALRLRALAPPPPPAPRDRNPRDWNARGASSTTPFRKIVTPTPLPGRARALPLSRDRGESPIRT